MGIKLKQFVFSLDRTPVYKPGEVVTGSCLIGLDGQLNLSQLHIKLEGVAQCKWEERYTTSTTNSDGETTTRTETRTICSTCCLLDLQYKPGNLYPTVLSAGQHRIEFNFQLPSNNLPSSFEGYYGHIRYRLRAKIHTPMFTFDKRNEITITMRAPAYYPMPKLMSGVKNSRTKTIGFFSSKKLTISCHLSRIGHNIGSTIPIECYVENNSKKTMELRATLKQMVEFYAEGRHKHTKDKAMLTKGSVIQPKGNQTEVLSLFVPSTGPVTSYINKLIKINYKITVTLVIPNHFDLHCELPCIITDELFPVDAS